MGQRTDRESPIQIAIVDYLRAVLPGAIVHHCRNEINKRGAAVAIELAKAARKGAVAGFPDLLILPPGGPAFFFEVKAPGGYASAAQREVHARLLDSGYQVAVVRSIDDARARLIEWGVRFVEKIEHRGIVS